MLNNKRLVLYTYIYIYTDTLKCQLKEKESRNKTSLFVPVCYFPDLFIFVSIQGKDWKSKYQ